MSGQTTRDSDKFMLRFPDGMRDAIKTSAADNNRSMNAEIIHALEAYLDRRSLRIDFGPPVDPNTVTPEDLRDGEPPIPISPAVRQAMEQMVKQIADHATRRFQEFLWLNEADKPPKE